MGKLNRNGLSRYIEAHITRQIRKECGYGCVICGDAIFQYEHIDPEFSEAEEHSPERMATLCGSCHDKVTRGFWSKEKVIEARLNPFCKQKGISRTVLDISRKRELVVRIGKTEFGSLQSIIEIDGEEILSVYPPEERGGPPRISAKFFNRDDKEIASIVNNEWFGSSEAFDIEAKGGKFKIKNSETEVDLQVTLIPPNIFQIDQINLSHNGARIFGSSSTGFKVELMNASILIPPRPKRINQAPFWLSIRSNYIAIGSECVGLYNRVYQMGYFQIQNADAEIVDPISIGSPFSNDAWKITGRDGDGLFLTKFLGPTLKQEVTATYNTMSSLVDKRKRHRRKL